MSDTTTVTEAGERDPQQLVGRRVRVHLNLHRGDFSISDPKTGNVLASCTDATLSGVTFKVSESTRQRIIAKNRRRVHAWAVGILEEVDTTPAIEGAVKVSYNPFRGPEFMTADGPIHEAGRIAFVNRFGWVL